MIKVTTDFAEKGWRGEIISYLCFNTNSKLVILLSSVIYPTLKQLLSNWLQAALNDYIANNSVFAKQQSDIIHKAKDAHRVVYVSGTAMQLSKVQNIPAAEIGTQISLHLRHVANTNIACTSPLQKLPSVNLLADFTVQVLSSGLMYFELTPCAIANWLQYLVDSPPTQQKLPTSPKVKNDVTADLFCVQYAHARCCSLLRLAASEKLTQVQAVAPQPLPWLDAQTRLRCCSPAERALISQLFAVIDALYPAGEHVQINWQKAALALTQAWQDFYTRCQIWGVNRDDQNLAQVRLGLLLITQSVLYLTLQKLGRSAPLEL